MTKLSRRDVTVGILLPVAAIGAVLALAVWFGEIGPEAAVAGLLASGLFAGGFAALRRTRRALIKVTDDLADVSGRLLRMEAQTAVRPVEARPRDEALTSLSGDLGLLGGAMKTLTEAMTEHEKEIAGLKDRLDRPEPATVRTGEALVIPSLFRDPVPAASRPPATSRLPAVNRPPAGDPAPRDAMAAAISGGELDVLVQPVVSLPQRRTVLLEIVARLRLPDGALLGAAELTLAAGRLHLSSRLDEKIFGRACGLARAAGATVSTTLGPDSLRDQTVVDRLCLLGGDVGPGTDVVAVSGETWIDPAARTGMATLARRGIALMLDDVSPDLLADPFELAAGGIRYVSIAASQLLEPDAGRLSIERRLTDLDRCGILVVAGQVDREPDVPELIELGVPLAQGPLFGLPKAPTLSAPTLPARTSPPVETPEPVSREAPPTESPSGEARSLRSTLRRAG